MSRLTSLLPFNKPSALDVIRSSQAAALKEHTETDTPVIDTAHHQSHDDTLHQSIDMHGITRTSSSAFPSDLSISQQPPLTSSPSMRRMSTLNYNQGFSRDFARESVPPVKKTRWLVLVLPSKSFDREPASYGHHYAGSPEGRFQHGVLIALFPTLYAQLTAIAREYNMPSTAGLALYLHLNNSPLQHTPRLSDEAWPHIWAHVLEDTSPLDPRNGPPIAGTVEFDVDVRKGRWLDSWLGKIIPNPEVRTGESSTTHSRQPSLLSFEVGTENRSNTDLFETNGFSRSRRSQAPRRLSLLDGKTEVSDNAKQLRLRQSLQLNSANDTHHQRGFILSPVAQAEEPMTAKDRDLRSRVSDWIESSPALHQPHHSPLEAIAPTSLPQSPFKPSTILSSDNALAFNAEEPIHEELDLDDFAWSVTSKGPGSYNSSDIDSLSPRTSVHLLERIQGSVCQTPSIATSFGPNSDVDECELLSSDSFPLSPDIGMRVQSNVPCTPTTATSWGVASWVEQSISPSEAGYSVDIAGRCMSDACCTPTTATTWGPSSPVNSLPESPIRVRTPDIVERTILARRVDLNFSSRTFPYYDAWKGTPWPHTWPYINYRVNPDVPDHVAELSESIPESSRNSFSYYDAWKHMSRLHTWSYVNHEDTSKASAASVIIPRDAKVEGRVTAGLTKAVSQVNTIVQLPSYYPQISLYPNTYPHLEIYPETIGSGALAKWHSFTTVSNYPVFDIYPPVRGSSYKTQSAVTNHLLDSYSHMVIYSTAYPAFDIYPARLESVMTKVAGAIQIQLPASYPSICLYSAAYPHFDLYPSCTTPIRKNIGSLAETGIVKSIVTRTSQVVTTISSNSQLGHGYPYIAIYTPVHPFLEVYPELPSRYAGHRKEGRRDILLKSPSISQYPAMVIYPTVYPHIELYAPPAAVLDSRAVMTSTHIPLSAAVSSYPNIVIYPSVYPHIALYPTRAGILTHSPKCVIDCPSYSAPHPFVTVYPAVYPAFDLYPERATESNDSLWTNLSHSIVYPNIVIYPQCTAGGHHGNSQLKDILSHRTVYPNLVNYPRRLFKRSNPVVLSRNILSHTVVYPNMIIYPGQEEQTIITASCSRIVQSHHTIYPDIDIYPSVTTRSSTQKNSQKLLTYPNIVIYPSVYPHLVVYPPLAGTVDGASNMLMVRHPADPPFCYPSIIIYPAVYPRFDLYHGPSSETMSSGGLIREDDIVSTSTQLGEMYPDILWHEAFYPYLDIYPSQVPLLTVSGIIDSTLTPSKWRKSHRVLHEEVTNRRRWQKIMFKTGYLYPYLEIYPPVYPVVEVYRQIVPVFHTTSHRGPPSTSTLMRPRKSYSDLRTEIQAAIQITSEHTQANGHKCKASSPSQVSPGRAELPSQLRKFTTWRPKLVPTHNTTHRIPSVERESPSTADKQSPISATQRSPADKRRSLSVGSNIALKMQALKAEGEHNTSSSTTVVAARPLISRLDKAKVNRWK